MMTERPRVYIPAFSRNVNKVAHGGVRRTDQIRAAVAADVDFEFKYSFWGESLKKYPFQIIIEFISGFNFSITLKGNIRRAIYMVDFFQFIKSKKISIKKSLFFIELAPGATFYIANALRARAARYIVAAHNIEFFVPLQNFSDFRSLGRAAEVEINIYKSAQRAVAISNFDADVVSIFCKDTIIFPYFPSTSQLGRLVGIRRRREKKRSEESYFICIGTVTNTPSFEGMQRLIQDFCNDMPDSAELRVVGFGTEQLLTVSLDQTKIKILGGVSDEVLDDLLTNAQAAILYQLPTAGFLTRLVELNLANIPTFINYSYFSARHLEIYGIYQYRTLVDILKDLVRADRKYFSPPSSDSGLF